MTRALMPGRWDCHGRAVPDSQACELDNALGPDAYRVIQPPVRTPEDEAHIAKARRWALYLITTGMAAMAGLLELFGASPLLP